jgi:hypothetical protein
MPIALCARHPIEGHGRVFLHRATVHLRDTLAGDAEQGAVVVRYWVAIPLALLFSPVVVVAPRLSKHQKRPA